MTMIRKTGSLMAILALAWAFAPLSARATTALHVFCWGATPACIDNGTNTPTATNPPNFGFADSSGPATGNFVVDILIPNNEDPTPSLLSFGVTGTQGGATNSSALSGTASLFGTTAWTTGQLDSYLGISASPANPIGAYLPSTQSGDPSATGFFVYQVDLGTNKLWDIPHETNGPLLSISSGLAPWSYVVAFLNTGILPNCLPSWIATANSAALFETAPPGTVHHVPEPSALMVFAASLLGLGWMLRKRPA